MTKQTKAQLQAENEELRTQINELKNKKVERKFNIFENTYENIMRGYVASGEANEFSFNVRHLYDSKFTSKEGKDVKIEGAGKVIGFLNKKGALKVVNIEKVTKETGANVYEVKIKDFDILTKQKSKFSNGEYFLFKKAYKNVTGNTKFSKEQV